MNIALTPELEQFVRDEIQAGRFASAEEIVIAAIAFLQTTKECPADDVAELRSEIDAGIADADRGHFADFTAKQVIAERHAVRAARKKAS